MELDDVENERFFGAIFIHKVHLSTQQINLSKLNNKLTLKLLNTIQFVLRTRHDRVITHQSSAASTGLPFPIY